MFLFLLSHQMLPFRLLWTQTFFFSLQMLHTVKGREQMGEKRWKKRNERRRKTKNLATNPQLTNETHQLNMMGYVICVVFCFSIWFIISQFFFIIPNSFINFYFINCREWNINEWDESSYQACLFWPCHDPN